MAKLIIIMNDVGVTQLISDEPITVYMLNTETRDAPKELVRTVGGDKYEVCTDTSSVRPNLLATLEKDILGGLHGSHT